MPEPGPLPALDFAERLADPSVLVPAGLWVTVVVLVVVAMVRGWLVPGTQVDRLVTAYQRNLDDKDLQIADWRETARIEAARGDLLAGNQEKLLEASLTSHRLLEQTHSLVQKLAERERP